MFFPKLRHFTHYLWLHFHHHPISLVLRDSSNRAATTASLGSLGRVVSLEDDMDGQALFHLNYISFTSQTQKISLATHRDVPTNTIQLSQMLNHPKLHLATASCTQCLLSLSESIVFLPNPVQTLFLTICNLWVKLYTL